MYVFLWFFREFYNKQYGVVVYGHSVKYSYEIPNEYLSGSMAIFLLAYVAIFSDSFIFGKATSSQFFRVPFFKVSQEFFFRSSSFFRVAVFFEELFFQNSHFFQHFFYLFRAKRLPRNYTLRIGNSLVQLPLRTSTHRIYLQNSYFFKADSSAPHQLLQKKQDFEKGYIFRKAKFHITYFFWKATFLMPFSSIATFYSSYIFRRASFLRHTYSEELLFHRYPSFSQLHFLLTNH